MISQTGPAPLGARELLVGEKVVPQAIDQRSRHLAQLGVGAVRGVVHEHADQLVVRLVTIEEPEAADRPRAQDDAAVVDRPLGEHADVDRVAVADHALPSGGRCGRGRDAVLAPGARDEAVGRGAEARELERAVQLQVSGVLVDLVLDRVGRDQLDEDVHHVGGPVARRDAVPGMRLEPMQRGHAAQEITLASFQRAISSHVHPSSSRTSSVCAPVSCAGLRTVGGSPANCTGLAHTLTGPSGVGEASR